MRTFKRNKRKIEIKMLVSLLDFLELSLRKASEIPPKFESISHETVKQCYPKIKEVIKQPEKKERGLVAIDDVIKLHDKRIYALLN